MESQPQNPEFMNNPVILNFQPLEKINVHN